MRTAKLLLPIVLGLSAVEARSAKHFGRSIAAEINDLRPRAASPDVPAYQSTVGRQGTTILPQNANTTKYWVDGTKIPEVDFDIGESYAGLMPISSNPNDSSLYFWYFPTSNPNGTNDVTIWLNGGPGCSSLEGFLQENGPFLWQYGTFKPVRNPYTWVNLTNMIWVEQPVGTGFSKGVPRETSQEMVADSFLGFWKNFMDTFGLHGKNVYIAGESYAGMYVPYIADAMFTANNTDYYNVQGTMIYDPSINADEVLQEIPLIPYLNEFKQLLPLNESFMENIKMRSQMCGYTGLMEKFLQFPPTGPLPVPPSRRQPGCRIWRDVKTAIQRVNPCFDIYQVATTCPLLWDVLGFPGSFGYVPEGAFVYFNRTDVQKAINAPIQEWAECVDIPLDDDTSAPSAFTVLPRVIEKSKRTIIAHGVLDFILMYNGTLMAIQNMTWNGAQGFQRAPSEPFFVPYHQETVIGAIAGSGHMGTVHTERGLTWVEVALTGHMVPQYAPSAAYRHLEYLLGRVSSMSEKIPFTTQPNIAQQYVPQGWWQYAQTVDTPGPDAPEPPADPMPNGVDSPDKDVGNLTASVRNRVLFVQPEEVEEKIWF